ncbi:MAG: phosphoribosylamine--glycine ligase [Desulfonauticus sp.]|nr:phosphoribosylamine--glycine ligase [Desulfonauticus sp.]
MKVLIIGSGGREDALAWKISQSPLLTKLYIAPGNGGTASKGTNVALEVNDIPQIISFCQKEKIDLVVVGPELPLVLGIQDALDKEHIPCFGPNSFAAQLEGSKSFAKEIMLKTGVPTAKFQIFTDYEQALSFVQTQNFPLVIKADGLAAGKGVVIAKNPAQAKKALIDFMQNKIFGQAGEKVLIEEALVGEEVSFLAFCDGQNVTYLPSSQDHKRIGEHDTGPNTGGMGAYSPAPILADKDLEYIGNIVIKPIINELQKQGHPFVGILYAGLMLTSEGPKVLEYNVRFGDPECQPLMLRLKTDLLEIIQACLTQKLNHIQMEIDPKSALCVVIAAKGYPQKYPKGMEISGLDKVKNLSDVIIFHAGTKQENGKYYTNGGRVLNVTALGKNLIEAKKKAYEAAKRISFPNMYYRKDIGDKGIAKLEKN